MNEAVRPAMRPAADPAASLAKATHWIFFGLFLLALAVVLLRLLDTFQSPGPTGWPGALLVLAATATTLISLSRQLPSQNVLLATAAIAFIAAVVESIGAATAIPFGPFSYTDEAGPRLWKLLAWPVPLVWVIAILNSRGVARLILRPWRKLKAYGFWFIGLTAVLTMLFDFSLEPFATRVNHYWFWNETKFPVTWHGAPVVNFLGWLLTALLILVFVTPALINKLQRPTRRPPDYHPLAIWLLVTALFAAGAVTRQLWPAVGFSIAASILAAVFAIRGAKW